MNCGPKSSELHSSLNDHVLRAMNFNLAQFYKLLVTTGRWKAHSTHASSGAHNNFCSDVSSYKISVLARLCIPGEEHGTLKPGYYQLLTGIHQGTIRIYATSLMHLSQLHQTALFISAAYKCMHLYSAIFAIPKISSKNLLQLSSLGNSDRESPNSYRSTLNLRAYLTKVHGGKNPALLSFCYQLM